MRVLLDSAERFSGAKIFHSFLGNFNTAATTMKSHRMFIKDMGYTLPAELLNANPALSRNKIYRSDVFRPSKLVIKTTEFSASYSELLVGEEGGLFLLIVVSCRCLLNAVCKRLSFVDDLLISRQ